MKAAATNRLVNAPCYAKIITLYNEMLQRDGKVNNKKFYEDYILPELPGYHLQSWYMLLKRFKTEAGIVAATIHHGSPATIDSDITAPLSATLMNNKDATAKALSLALNIGMDRLQAIMENPQMMTAKEAVDLVFKAMKAQDSRIHAIGRVREDNREEEKMDRAFEGAAYE